MRQVFRTRAGGVTVEEVPFPGLDRGQVLVKNAFSLISSGTESKSLSHAKEDFLQKIRKPSYMLRVAKKASVHGVSHLMRTFKSKMDELAPLGYSCVGEVVDKADDVANVRVGDVVACMGAEFAFHAEYVAVPRNLVVSVPKKLSLEEAAFVTLGSISLHGVRNAQIQIGDRVGVVGLGLIGQLVVQLLKVSGCHVVGFDMQKQRISLAQELGMEKGFVLGPEETDIREMIGPFVDHRGLDAVIVCSTGVQPWLFQQLANACRDRARFVIVGQVPLQLPYELFYRKEISFLVSRSTGPGRYDPSYELLNQSYPSGYVRWTERDNAEQFLSLLADGKIHVRKLISSVIPLEEAQRAYALLSEKESLGILLKYSSVVARPEDGKTFVLQQEPLKIAHEKIGVGISGLGRFATGVLLPRLVNNDRFALHGVMSKSPGQSKSVGKQFSARYCTTDYQQLLQDPAVDLVMITSRNDLHAGMTIAAAQAKKHIFLEKPMALTPDDLKAMVREITHAGVFFTLGLNRRYSPLIEIARSVLREYPGPYFIVYRFQDDRQADRSWVEDRAFGGGRVLHLCNHMVDVCSWLIGSEPVEVFSQCVGGDGGSVIPEDNVGITTRFSDGSLSTMVYTSLGSPSMERERIEIYFANKTMVISNYQSLHFFGIPRKNIELAEPDKGYQRQLEAIGRHLSGEPVPEIVTLHDAVRSNVFCFLVLESLKKKTALPFSLSEYFPSAQPSKSRKR